MRQQVALVIIMGGICEASGLYQSCNFRRSSTLNLRRFY